MRQLAAVADDPTQNRKLITSMWYDQQYESAPPKPYRRSATLATALSLFVGWGLAQASAPAAQQQQEKPQPHFDVLEYRVLGNSMLQIRDIERLLYPLLGKDKQLPDVEAARTALEKLYHDRGFGTVFVDIPPQEVNEGIVRLRVTEGRLRERTISGARYFSERDVLAALPASAPGTVPNLHELQRQITALNGQTSDRSVVPVLKAGPAPGTMDIDLKVDDKLPLHGSVELDDDYTIDTKPLRASVGLSYANLFAALDTLSLQYQDSPQAPSAVNVLNVAYQTRPLWDDIRLSFSFIDSNSNVATAGTGGGPVGVLGKGQIFSLRMTDPLIATPESQQSLTLGLDYKHFRNTVAVGGASALVTPIYYTNVSAGYAGAWNRAPAEGSLDVTANFGPRGAPNGADDFENDRYLARPNYFYVRADGSVTGHLPLGFRLSLRLAGQWTAEPLISNENFSMGGADGVRGYLSAEELGDTGIKGSVQLQSPTWSWQVPQLVNVFIYYDDGHTHLLDPLSSQPTSATLRSWGGGLDLLPGHSFSGMLAWADPLANGSYTLAHQSRVLFLFRGAF